MPRGIRPFSALLPSIRALRSLRAQTTDRLNMPGRFMDSVWVCSGGMCMNFWRVRTQHGLAAMGNRTVILRQRTEDALRWRVCMVEEHRVAAGQVGAVTLDEKINNRNWVCHCGHPSTPVTSARDRHGFCRRPPAVTPTGAVTECSSLR